MRGPPGPALPAGPTARTFSLWLAKSSTFLNRKLHSLGWGRKASPVRATGGRNGSGADRAHLHSMARRAQAAGTAPAATCGRYAAGAELGTVGPRGRREECWRRRIPMCHTMCHACSARRQQAGHSGEGGVGGPGGKPAQESTAFLPSGLRPLPRAGSLDAPGGAGACGRGSEGRGRGRQWFRRGGDSWWRAPRRSSRSPGPAVGLTRRPSGAREGGRPRLRGGRPGWRGCRARESAAEPLALRKISA